MRSSHTVRDPVFKESVRMPVSHRQEPTTVQGTDDGAEIYLRYDPRTGKVGKFWQAKFKFPGKAAQFICTGKNGIEEVRAKSLKSA